MARFLTLTDVAEVLNTSLAQVRALVQSGELRSIQIGGRHQYRVEDVELEAYIRRMYERTDARTGRQPGGSADPAPDGADRADTDRV